jgi:hypothetical protein
MFEKDVLRAYGILAVQRDYTAHPVSSYEVKGLQLKFIVPRAYALLLLL